MKGKVEYRFSAKMWKVDTANGWHFISLPKRLSEEIRENLGWQESGWGRMKATAEIADIQWETAIWFDTKLGRYVLPVKAKIRTVTKIKVDSVTDVMLWI